MRLDRRLMVIMMMRDVGHVRLVVVMMMMMMLFLWLVVVVMNRDHLCMFVMVFELRDVYVEVVTVKKNINQITY